jgi:predicted GIY-YIG superfamily endonuclease
VTRVEFSPAPDPRYRRAVSESWWVYVVRCRDGTLYTGIARDVERRLEQHDQGKGARYTRGRGPVHLLARAGPMPRPDALRLELAIKRLPRARKLAALER